MHTDAAVFVQGYPFGSRNQGVAFEKIKIRHTTYGISLSCNNRKTVGLLLCPLRGECPKDCVNLQTDVR